MAQCECGGQANRSGGARLDILCPVCDMGEPLTPSERLRDVTCPQCKKPFELNWNDYSDRKQTLILRGCPSGGIYDVSIECPHCDYHEDL